MAGGGTGGHVVPSLAVARELAARGHRAIFVGTRAGLEAKLVPPSGFEIEWIETGAWQRVSLARRVKTLWQVPAGFGRAWNILSRSRAAAVFSLGGYVAAPVVAAALARRIPVVAMEPNAMPGLVNRLGGRWVSKALLGFQEAAAWFPKGRSEVTGVPVRAEFFAIPPKPPGEEFTVLITGGSRGSRTLNQAFAASWALFKEAGVKVRFRHQSGVDAQAELARAFGESGLAGSVDAFIADMPAAFAAADLIVCRSGANTVAELAAAGRASILVPFPFAADDHQKKNAGAMERAGAARLVPDRELDGARLFAEVMPLLRDRDRLARMAEAAKQLAHPGAAERAAAVLEELI
jgi:UDP-N-acetylglucosamine--N-acetylmuramyl-(pentapeptide) pyrophosphoryl-undecaprenol N-acetylglucosamine transferase